MTNLSQEPLAGPVRVTDLADLVAGLPVLFGFRPTDSLVVVSVESSGRVGFRLRVNLPPVDLADQVADYLTDVLRRNAARTVFVIACSGDPAVADPVVHALVRRLRAGGFVVGDAVRCDGGRFWSYVCADPVCCPPEGRAYDESSSSLVAAAVLGGMAILPDRATLAARVGPIAGADRERMEHATAAAAVDVLGGRDPSEPPGDDIDVQAGVREVRAVVDAAIADPDRALSDAEAARLAVWCSLRGVALAALSRIDRDNADEQLRIWSEVARKSVPPYESAVLGLAGFGAWLSGDGALAWCAVERADRIDDAEDPLIDLLRRLLEDATPPSAWEGVEAG